MVIIRSALPSDALAITEIYNQGIQTRRATFETCLYTVENRRKWIVEQEEHYPILVAVLDELVVGFACVHPYRSRDCYRGIGEFSIYIRDGYKGRGIGKQLLHSLVEACAKRGYWKLVSRIFDFNHASRALCRACGFREVGIYEKHSKLDGEWLDCVIVEKLIIENLD
ncbi:arsinothricin resistance N-acetyltransferase ArsN1 family A [Thermoactinomyces sp. CICC 10522]|uniref:arsinothricin resistance N-acetyltransferase ArsN1 family A n=1 Tax=Thermoactinomyces sp. CICC 10522 TaxID=2767427 RepID=UPI0018DEAD25|nr:arsinothricin resistance N-acetyltransferase ArsN1 family A [Thermoactinomyces sp. CICC 10522]MBH8605880.1 N-acetyltransferase [Thermoactinomyces sp. CICC 10522]